MGRCLAGAVVVALASSASADVETLTAETKPVAVLEAGVYGGGFISNFFHQFYDVDAQPNRQELERVNMELGVRFAYFLNRWFGVEVEGAWVRATTKQTGDGASIFSGRAQALVQHKCPCTTLSLPEQVVPFASLGLGVWRVSSSDDVLGSDTDMLLHVGGGIRFFATPSIAIRAEARFLRGPSQQAPYHLNASYGEFMLGVSFVPTFGRGGDTDDTKVVVAGPPKVDTDSDGVADDADKCPAEAEDRDLYDDGDGCPDPDNDGDGILDAVDRCLMEAEDKDGFEDDDGCVDRDNDADGVADAQDACPSAAEDRDGYRDGDGCPDPDNDKDGVADLADKCPTDAEVINGVDDEDGCPDRGDALVVLSTDRLELLAPLMFTRDKLTKESVSVLAQVAGMLRQHDQILRLRITVHVHPTRNAEADQAMSDRRGAAVKDFLVNDKGVDAKRLEVRGFGSSKPLVPKKAKNAALINDRVELIILERR
ncbi:MAG: OmpA family protein [Deltaproteobacteria bacterium]|nr:OmpA family protein [Deltaproteobacteria bacterium]